MPRSPPHCSNRSHRQRRHDHQGLGLGPAMAQYPGTSSPSQFITPHLFLQTYQGHTHYIMNIAFNPKDSNTFVSACLDRTLKMWSIAASTPNFTMDAHEKGVNYVDFYPGSDRPYLVTTGDDKTVKVWDYLSKSCVQTLQGHTNNVSFAVFHPSLPVILSGSEDGTVKIWNSGTYRIEHTLSYSLERAWCLALRKDTNEVAVGFDDGVVVFKVLTSLSYLSHPLNYHLAW